MTGVVSSPKKGKENKNISNHIPVPNGTLLLMRKNAKNEAKTEHTTPKKEKTDNISSSSRSPPMGGVPKRLLPGSKVAVAASTKPGKPEGETTLPPPPPAVVVQNGGSAEEDSSSSSTSHRSVRPQTKILRRPTPNLKHPVIIQVVVGDSDDSGNSDSGNSDKAIKDDKANPKRLKMGNNNNNNNSNNNNSNNGEVSCDEGTTGNQDSTSSSSKRKNFIMYNKYNVDKNTSKNPKERTSATLVVASSIPNPCTSCNRSQAPERLHSHARKDARGLMNGDPCPTVGVVGNGQRRSPDVKMASSPQKRPSQPPVDSKAKLKEVRSSPCSPITGPKNASTPLKSVVSSRNVPRELKKSPSESNCAVTNRGGGDSSGTDSSTEYNNSTGPKSPRKELVEPLKACYICQKDFKISELFLHESKCLETWKKTNNSLNPNLRQLPPRRPPGDSSSSPSSLLLLDEDLTEADPAWSSVQSQLIPCPLCARTFFPERLPVHRRVCKGKASPRPLKRASSLREQSASSASEGEESKPAPLYLPCYVCGRNYGSWVLPMHEQQCLKKWRSENDQLADEEKQEEPRRIEDEDVASLIELGDTAWESHLQQLVPCPRCSRTFFPDRLEIHERSCKGPSCNRRPRSNKGI